MNHQDIEQLFSRARAVRLSEEAKASGRAVLLARMSSAAVPTRTAARFPWFGASWLRAGSFASLLLLVGGTTWAAEGALPGDALYAWKTKVNEPTRLAVLPTSSARAEWSVELLSRRLKEAEALASSGQLNSETQAFLEEKLNQERDRADAYSQSGGDENCDEIEAEIKLRIEGVQHVEVREDAGRLRIRVREEHEEKESEEEKRRENEVRHEDGWIEETELHEEQHESDGDDDDTIRESRSLKNETKESASIKKTTETKTGSTSSKSPVMTSGSTKSQASSAEDNEAEDADEETAASSDDEDELISESAARSKALAAVPGTVKESELKDEDDDPVWEVKIQRSSDNEEVKVVVDAQSGSIKEIED